MTIRRIAVTCLSVAVLISACSGGDDTESGNTGLELALAADGTTVEATVTNRSDDLVTVVRPFVTPHFVEFTVVGGDGAEIPFDGPNLRLEPLVDSDVATLDPGESVSARFDLSDHFTLAPGTYTVSATYQAEEIHHGGLALTIASDQAIVADPIEVVVP